MAHTTSTPMAPKTPKPREGSATRKRGFSEFVGWVKAYRELILAVAGIVGFVFLVLGHFATKSELAVMRCQLDLQIDLADSRFQAAELSRKLTVLKQKLTTQGTSRSSASADAEEEDLETAIKDAKEEQSSNMKRRKGLEDKLLKGFSACQPPKPWAPAAAA
jgi:hypothetical protein